MHIASAKNILFLIGFFSLFISVRDMQIYSTRDFHVYTRFSLEIKRKFKYFP